MRRSVAALLLALVGFGAGCRRDAAAPIAGTVLFPDAGPTAAAVPVSAQGSIVRAESVTEAEPNDSASEAQAISGNAVVEGNLGRPADARTADPTAKDSAAKPLKSKSKAKGMQLLDADWYRLPAAPAGQITTLDLRRGPACAELELYDDTGRTLLKRARWWRQVRPVLASVGPEARASLVRVSCLAKGADAQAGGAYQLAVWTRPARPDEEIEPNDKAGPIAQPLKLGATMQGTLAPLEDVDTYTLDLAGAVAGEALLLGVAGVPDVELELQLLDPVTQQPLLVRRPGKGASIAVPNLDPRRTGDHPLAVVRAVSGMAPDTNYALSIQTFLPPGCARQAECAHLLPTEREPDDTRVQANLVQTGVIVTGMLDGLGDVDWYEVAGRPVGPDGKATAVVQLRLQGPPGLTLGLQIGEEPTAMQVLAVAGQPLLTGGVLLGAQPLALQVHAKGAGANPNQAYRLEIQVTDMPDFEVEAGDELHQPGLLTPAHALVANPIDATHPAPSWQRHGALLPAGDKDAFWLDFRSRPGPTGVMLTCQGDGTPGLRCALLDGKGNEVAKVQPAALAEAQVPAALPPGVYKVTVTADPAHASPQPYLVAVHESAEALALAAPVTPTGLPQAATP